MLADTQRLFQSPTRQRPNPNLSEQSSDHAAVNIFRLFRFANRIDMVLMFISMCLTVFGVLCFLTIMFLFGRLTGMFAAESSAEICTVRYSSSIDQITCPLGIDLNPMNFARLHRFCYHRNETILSTLLVSTDVFREQVFSAIYQLLVLGTIQVLSVTMDTIIWTTSIRRQVSRMNIQLLRSLIQRNLFYFDTNSMNQINAKLFSNIETIETGIGLEFKILIYIILCVTGSLITSYIIDWKLTFIIFCIMPFIFAGSFIFGKVIAKETTKQIQVYSKVGQIVEEVFSSLRTVHSFNGSAYEQTRYEKELHHIRWSGLRKGMVLGIYIGCASLPKYIVYAVGFMYGSVLLLYEDDTKLTISDILVIVSVLAMCLKFLGSIGPYLESLFEAQAAAVSVFRLIDENEDKSINEPDLWSDDRNFQLQSNINGDIEFDRVNFSYPSRSDVSVLRDLSLIARAGETTALVGFSGCGKSTCNSLLLRQYELSSGDIRINGQSIADFNLRYLRQNIGVVSQEPILFNTSIYENIRFGRLNATQADIEEAARQANAHQFIMQLPNKYGTFVGERGTQLSGGEKQRIALARALIKLPSILLLDEATSALDNVSEKIVQEALDRASKDRTTIVIAHRLTTIQHAHQIYVLDNGNVIEHGTHQTLMKINEGKYRAMVERQNEQRMNDDQKYDSMPTESFEEKKDLSSEHHRFLDDEKQDQSSSTKQKSIFLRLLAMNSPEWIIILCGSITCALNGMAQTIFAYLLGKIISGFSDCMHSKSHHQVMTYGVYILLLGVLSLILRFVQHSAFSIAGSKLTQRIRLKTFSSLLRQEMGYFDRMENSSAAISVRLSSGAAALEQMIGPRLAVIAEPIAMCLFAFLAGLFISWQLTMLLVLAFLITGILGALKVKINTQLAQQYHLIQKRANALAIEFLHNIRTIKQLSVEKEILRQYSELVHQVFRMSRRPNILFSIVFGITWGIDGYFLALLYWCALVLYENNKLSSNNIVMVFSFAIFATQSLKVIGSLSKRIGSSLTAARDFFDLFDRTPSIDNASTNGQELMDFRGEIQFDGVTFAYPTRPNSLVLNQLQLMLKSGQRVALVGASGCGKSTVIQLLERFYDVNEGQLLLDGVDIRQLNIHWLRSQLGLVSQEPVLFDLTIAENITYGLENVSMDEIINAAIQANIHEFIMQLPQGYETRVGMKGHFLSGGEKQRIAIARVLIRRPKILLFDEATSALDLYNEHIVQRALEQAQTNDSSRTSLTIAHRLSTIRSSDLICVLDRGKIVESGTHLQLLEQRQIYYEMLTQHTSQLS